MGVLGRMYKLLAVAGPSQEGLPSNRRPLQLQVNDFKRELEHALRDGQPAPEPIQAKIDQLTAALDERNVHGQELEAQDQLDAAIALYESNVDDMYEGGHPYDRLLAIYEMHHAHEDAERIARACLVHCTAGLSQDLRARCLNALNIDDQAE